MSLASEIRQVYAEHAQHHNEHQQKEDIMESFKKRLENAFRHQYKWVDVFLVGSSENGFGLRGSDMDLGVILQNSAFVTRNEPNPDKRVVQIFRDESLVLLKRIFSQVQKGPYDNRFIAWNSVREAKVPILIGEGREGFGFRVSVDLHIDNTSSVRNTHLMRCYSKADDRVAPLVVAVKVWAEKKRIYKSPTAPKDTLSGYSIALLVIYYLQNVDVPVVPCLQVTRSDWFREGVDLDSIRKHPGAHEKFFLSKNTSDLGSLFKGFFEFYSSFDFQNHGISVRTGKLLSAQSLRQSNFQKWKLLCIEEPFYRSNVAKSIENQSFLNKIVQEINRTHRMLSSGYRFHNL